MYNLDNELLNADGLDTSVSKRYSQDYSYSSADGESPDGDEESVEYEYEDSEVGGVEPADLPKFRSLVRAKKVALKNQYGKGHFKNESSTSRECKTIKVPQGYTDRQCRTILRKEVCVNVPKVRMVDKEVCVNVPHVKIVWVSGWRKKWKEFKQAGGLKDFKAQSKGLAPLTPSVPTSTPTPASAPTPTNVASQVTATPKKTFTLITPPKNTKITDFSNNSKINRKAVLDKREQEKNNPSNTSTTKGTDSKSPSEGSEEVESTTEKKKFLGMPKAVGIAVVIIGVAAIGFGAYKLIKK